jgi:hypothetical protein
MESTDNNEIEYSVLTGFALSEGKTIKNNDINLSTYVLEGHTIEEILTKQLNCMLQVFAKSAVEKENPGADYYPKFKELQEQYQLVIKK